MSRPFRIDAITGGDVVQFGADPRRWVVVERTTDERTDAPCGAMVHLAVVEAGRADEPDAPWVEMTLPPYTEVTAVERLRIVSVRCLLHRADVKAQWDTARDGTLNSVICEDCYARTDKAILNR